LTLPTYCTGCGELLPDRARFCPACGHEVAATPHGGSLDESIGEALATELRDLTVVVCDLVGSTRLSAVVDTEEYGDLIHAYQQQAVTIVRALGGDVEGYSGDGILFRFGWPQAHEDDAVQALSAALDILDAVAGDEVTHDLALRIGVHSGPAVVGTLGGADRRATMSVGETLNVASRLQGAAEPGTVVASAATLALAGSGFATTPLGPLALRGLPEPVEAFRVDGRVAGRGDALGRMDHTTPLVGRVTELAALDDAWRQVLDGRGGGVVLTGEPGVGKTRLVAQVRDRVRDDDPLWLETSCARYTRLSVLRPIVELVEAELGPVTGDDPHAWIARLRDELDEDRVDVPDAAELIGSLLGVTGTPVDGLHADLRLERTVDALVAWVVTLSRRRPVVLCIEDLHWCDPTTLDAIGRLLELAADAPVLVLATTRPECTPTWATSAGVRALTLPPLADADVRALAAALGDGLRLPDQVVDRIVSSAGGIPLFVEVVARSVLESGLLVRERDRWDLASPLMDLEIPTTLQASLLARLDGLGPAKAVAQLAAVLGRTFGFDLLATVSGMDRVLLARFLDQVVASGLVLHDPAGDGFTFAHSLVQEAAYGSLLRKNRRTIHERVARVLDERVAAGDTTAPEVVARHYEAADLPYEAATRYERAARLAADRSGHREAVSFLRRAIDLAAELYDVVRGRELEVELQLSLGSALATRSYADPELAAAYGRARELCELLGNDGRIGMSLGGLSLYYLNRGETELGATLAERVIAIADANEDDLLGVLGRVQLGLARSWQGRPAECLALATRAVADYDPVRHRVLGHRFGTDQGVAAHVFAGWSSLLLGRLDRGLAHLSDAVALAESIGEPFNVVYARTFLATGHTERGESAEALAIAADARRMAEELGFSFWAGIAGVWEGAVRVAGGDAAAFDAVLQAGFAAGSSGNMGGSSNVLGQVAEAAFAAGDRDMTAGILDTALALSAETGQPWWDAALHRQVAELRFAGATEATPDELTRADHPWARAADEWLLALELAERMQLPVHGARAAAGYAGLLARTGRGDEARRLLDGWYGRCTEGRDTPVLVAVRRRLDELGGPLGRAP